MARLTLHEFHHGLNASFADLNGVEVVSHYGDPLAEHTALRNTAVVLDLSFRGRLCVTGSDRLRFLNGQVTNDVKSLSPGEGCYAALVTAKGKMQSDLNIYCLTDELLLDFEPGLGQAVAQLLEKYIIADDVQVVDAAPHYGLLSVQGPKAEAVVCALGLFGGLFSLAPREEISTQPKPTPNPSGGAERAPATLTASSSPPGRGQGWVEAETICAKLSKPLQFVKTTDATLGEIYLMNHPRVRWAHLVASPARSDLLPLPATQERGEGRGEGQLHHSPSSPQPSPPSAGGAGESTRVAGFDLFVPTNSLGAVADKLIAAVKAAGGRACGWQALETARIEAGIPRFGADMDETNIPLEAGLDNRAISFTKGCYIGQEVIARIRTYGQVAKALRGLRLANDLETLPAKGDKLFHAGKEVGYITSAVASPTFKANIALGYVRREHNQIGTELTLRLADGESHVKIVALPFGQ